jgi:hypothetical protein
VAAVVSEQSLINQLPLYSRILQSRLIVAARNRVLTICCIWTKVISHSLLWSPLAVSGALSRFSKGAGSKSVDGIHLETS